MRVTDYELYVVPPRWTFLKIVTSDGLVGWGDPTVPYQYNAVEGTVKDLMEKYILGNSPLEIEDRWQQMYRQSRYRGGPIHMSSLGGIDMALWDIKGKHYNAPIYELLGGPVRDSIRLYQHIRAHRPDEAQTDLDSSDKDSTPEIAAEDAKRQVDKGFTALKMTPTEALRRVDSPAAVEAARKRVGAVREAVGDDIDIGLDLHGRMSKPMAKRMVVELEEFEPMFYEEPLIPEQEQEFAEIASHTSIPIATGERIVSRWEFRRYLENLSLDIIQPDTSHAGGITEVNKIANMAETYDVALAIHSPYGPMNVASALQVDAVSQNAIIQEQLGHSDHHGDFDLLGYINNPEIFDYDEGGYLKIPEGPGLGLDVNEEFVEKKAEESADIDPQWRLEDGSVAER